MTGDKYGDTEPYFLYFMVAGLISGIILCITATIKYKLNYGRHKSQPTTGRFVKIGLKS
jgi:hypothetical protein